jgi:hypothetical protein
MKKDYTLILLVVLIVSQIAVSTLIVSLSHRGQRERAKNREYTLQVKQESLSLKCLLIIPNAQRTQESVAECDRLAEAQVNKER